MSWDDLSMREKAAMMRVAVKNKIFDIDNIKKLYNSYAEGGPTQNNILWVTLEDAPEGWKYKTTDVNTGQQLDNNKLFMYNGSPLMTSQLISMFGEDNYIQGKTADGHYYITQKGAEIPEYKPLESTLGEVVVTAKALPLMHERQMAKIAVEDLIKHRAEMNKLHSLEGTLYNYNQPATMNYISLEIDKLAKLEEITQRLKQAKQKEKDALVEAVSWVPVVGEIKDLYDAGVEAYKGNYGAAAAGLGLMLLPEWAEKGIKKGGKALLNLYNNYKDTRKLRNIYKKVGTGLSNPQVKSKYNKAKKDPKTALNFLNNYSDKDISGTPLSNDLTIDQMKEAMRKLDDLEALTGYRHLIYIEPYEFDEVLNGVTEGVLAAKTVKGQYLKLLKFLESQNPILADIAKKSPQYLLLIYDDLISGKITDVNKYVKDLFTLANTFLRRMNPENGDDAIKLFSTIGGKTLSYDTKTINVGNIPTVFDPIWSRNYGNTVVKYTPKWEPKGDVSTWWDQRFPKFLDKSIKIDSEGILTDYKPFSISAPLEAERAYNSALALLGVPLPYLKTNSHIIFHTPNEGSTISDAFNVEIVHYPDYEKAKYSLGYKHGGKINRFDEGGAVSTSLNTLTKNLKIDYLKNTYKTKFIDLPDDLFMADHFNNTLGLYENSSDDLIDYHYLKALREVQNGDAIHYDLPEIVVNAYSPLKLHTYYPLENRRYAIGHSSLGFEKSDKWIDSTPELLGYNLLTNNCSDDTGKCLEQVFGKSMDVIGFTTPGDVRDFALENGGYEKNGVVYVPMNEERLRRFNRYAWEYNKRRGLENMNIKDYPGAVLPEIKNISTDLY